MWRKKVKREAEKRERQSENVKQIPLEIACKGMWTTKEAGSKVHFASVFYFTLSCLWSAVIRRKLAQAFAPAHTECLFTLVQLQEWWLRRRLRYKGESALCWCPVRLGGWEGGVEVQGWVWSQTWSWHWAGRPGRDGWGSGTRCLVPRRGREQGVLRVCECARCNTKQSFSSTSHTRTPYPLLAYIPRTTGSLL